MVTEQEREMLELEHRLRQRDNQRKAIDQRNIISARQQAAIMANICIGAAIVMLLFFIAIQWLSK
jgi:hypothetical protein